MDQEWPQQTDQEIKDAVRQIVSTSSSDEEIKQRLDAALGYPCAAAITSHLPTDEVGREAQVLVTRLDGLIRKDGAMVMIMFYGPDGQTIQL